MTALDHAFCLKVGEAINPQKNIDDFYRALTQVFHHQLEGACCHIIVNHPLACDSCYLPDAVPSFANAKPEHSRSFTLPLTLHGIDDAYLIIALPEHITLAPNAEKILALVISASLDNQLQNQALNAEKRRLETTQQKLTHEVDAQKGLLEQLHILHKISLRLWHAHSLDHMLHTAVYECIHALDFDRMAIFLINNQTGLMRGTYGTDTEGRVTNEQWYCTAIDDHFHAKSTLDKKQHINIYEQIALYHDSLEVGTGWNATISLWDGDSPIGWIACDNLLTGTPLKSYHSELLKLLGITMSQHLIQRRAQDELKALNLSLEQRVAARTAELEAANQKLNHISREDSLTQVPNRRMLDEKLEEEWRRALRFQTPLSILIADIDHFKQYNDRYGHTLGDECLQKVAKALSEVERRAGAILARFGGEEFVFLLPGSDRDNTLQVAKRALEAVRALEIPHQGSPIAPYVTISVGGKTTIPEQISHRQQLFTDADIALYEAKSLGKNQAFVL